MAVQFPTNLDDFTNPATSDTLDSPSHAGQHTDANDAIEALEAKVGKNSSAVTTSHDYKLSGVTGTDKAVSKTGAETLTNKTLTSPKIDTGINDTNSNELIKVTATASAVNEITLANAATGGNPTITASGGDSDIGIDFKPKGTGTVRKPSSVVIQVIDGTDITLVGDGKAYFTVPEELNGTNLVGVHAAVITAGTTNTTDIQIRNATDSVDMLSTKMTIDSGETSTSTAATPAVIDTSHDDVVTNDLIAIDIDAVSTTPAKGLIVRLRFALP